MLKKFDEIIIRLNQSVLISNKPWLTKSYGLLREFGIFALHYPSKLLNRKTSVNNNFIIYTQGRTGSTLLVDLLNSNPDIRCDREIFFFRTIFTEKFLEAKRSLYSGHIYGCKIQNYQLQRQVGHEGMHHFMKKIYEQGWKIIYLIRRNILRHALSNLVMQHRGLGKHHHYKKDGSLYLEKIHIDINNLFKMMQNILEYNALDEEVLNDIPHLRLVYEEDLLKSEYHQRATDKIFDYLGLESFPVKTELVRITSDDLSDFVVNFEELKIFINKTPYAKFL